ncbi:hypothetical protein ACFFMN_23070 [Planobispora siamensis]|uniref:Uncharacterized protein n=1 Tax=Planobispora siamensis TaxID=936338 RepID=A0A8J3WN65_9ACTN|nr:hypothetical protein [Planobispora siamensis]GIH95450.1 hypothetical protein Psi01_60800 [Planobispora siamensis]
MTLWRDRLYANPFGTMAAVAAIVLGILGAVLGDDVSRGMANSLANSADVVAHLWGVAFAVGGALKLIGLYRHRTTMEIPGLWVMFGGYSFYSLTVTTGLQVHGLAAGTISAALAVGCLLKVRLIMRQARWVAGAGGDGTV